MAPGLGEDSERTLQVASLCSLTPCGSCVGKRTRIEIISNQKPLVFALAQDTEMIQFGLDFETLSLKVNVLCCSKSEGHETFDFECRVASELGQGLLEPH